MARFNNFMARFNISSLFANFISTINNQSFDAFNGITKKSGMYNTSRQNKTTADEIDFRWRDLTCGEK